MKKEKCFIENLFCVSDEKSSLCGNRFGIGMSDCAIVDAKVGPELVLRKGQFRKMCNGEKRPNDSRHRFESNKKAAFYAKNGTKSGLTRRTEKQACTEISLQKVKN